MTKVILTGFKFKPIHIKKQRNKSSSTHVSKRLYCVCIEESPENFKAYINIPSDLEFPDVYVIPFTKTSYNLTGKTDIFSRYPDKNGKYTRLCRTKVHANSFPNLEELYTPFRDRYVYSGYIVNIDGQHEFEATEFIDHYINANHLVPNIKLNIKQNEDI